MTTKHDGPIPSPQPNAPEHGNTAPIRESGLHAALRPWRFRTILSSIMSGAALVTALGVLFGGYTHILNEAKAQSDAGVQPVEKRLAIVEQRQAQIQQDVHETQVDIRSLYKAVMSGQRQERLEAAPVAVAPIDGGIKP